MPVIFWEVYSYTMQFSLSPLAGKYSSPSPWADNVVVSLLIKPALPSAARMRKIDLLDGDVSRVLVPSHLFATFNYNRF